MLDSLDTWWSELSVTLRFFYIVGIVATGILALQTMLLLFGLDGADGVDADVDVDGDLGFVSVRTVIAFLTGLGWVGVILLEADLPLWGVLLGAVIAGLVLMSSLFFLMKFLWSLRESGTLDYRSAVGEIGSVYLPIPGNRDGRGQIEVIMQGRLQTVPAITSRRGRIENRTRVLVVDVLEDNTLVVIPDDLEKT